MTVHQSGRRFFESPHAAVYLLLIANIAIFGLCLRYAAATSIPAEVLLRNGAMYSLAIDRHEYWRLFAYGFLHADFLHITINMICLVLWGGLLEKRGGSFYFLIIYACSLIVGAIISSLTHSGPYLVVGASGAISGVMGALLCLWILAKINLSANFFIINLGLNLTLALSSSKIDWGAHFGGFAAGLIACALLDILEKLNALVFRCKFPEFVKINGLIIVGTLGILLWGDKLIAPLLGLEAWFLPAAYLIACCAAIKAIDLVLSLKKASLLS